MKEMIAMILAGGQGSRLGALTKTLAKPAVPFGGKYRIIDFALSNCTHSGVDTVGVLTQYCPLELNTYIGNGQPWDLDRNDGGVFLLPPYTRAEKGEWYKGTANAIYQNIGFADRFSPSYVLVLSGDHIYKMDYQPMLEYHKEKNASATIAVIDVPYEDASRFGIMSDDENGRITEFEEKPQKPKGTKASMGVYIFSWQFLKKYLIKDENNQKSHNDFGKDIIPSMLDNGERLFAYEFEGYWKDVGTVESYWAANMDLISDKPAFDLSDHNFVIFSRNTAAPPHFVSRGAVIRNSLVTEGCIVFGQVSDSIVFEGAHIGKSSVIKSSVLLPGSYIGDNVTIDKAIIGSRAKIGDSAYIGAPGMDCMYSDICTSGISLIGEGISIGNKVVVMKNSMVETNILTPVGENIRNLERSVM